MGEGREIPQRMGAVLLEGRGVPPTFGSVPVPRPGPGQVLVRMAAAPINPSDLGFIAGSYGFSSPFPLVPGFEGSGTVVAAGTGVLPRIWLGRRVACASSGTQGGSWAEYMVTSAASCVPLPRRLSFEQGAAAFVNPMTALAFMDIARKGRHRAVINTAAAGALGKMILRLGTREGLTVINVVRRPEQAEVLRSLGARHTLVSGAPGFTRELSDMARAHGATLVLDAVGGPLTRELLDAAPPAGVLLAYGFLSGEPASVDPRSLARTGKSVTGFFLPDWMGRQRPGKTLHTTYRMLKLLDGELATAVRRRLPFSSVAEALDLYQRDMSAGKVLLVPPAGVG